MTRFTPTTIALLGAAGALALTGCSTDGGSSSEASGSAEKVSVEHAKGTTEVPQSPEKVISLDLGVVDSLDVLGHEVQGLPKGGALPAEFDKYKDEKYVNAGAMKEPDLEAIAQADPDLIIISSRAADYYDQLSEIAPTVDLSIDQKDPVGSFKKQTETLGEIYGEQEKVESELGTIDEKLAETKKKAEGSGDAMFLLTSAGEVHAYGAKSRFGSIVFDELGIEPAADIEAKGSHGEVVSFEAIAKADPDRLYVIDRDVAIGQDSSGEAAKKVLDNPLVQKTTAAKDGKITYLDPQSWYLTGMGLKNFPAMVDEIGDSLP